MARHLRIEFPGAIYHVTCRMIGDGRQDRSRLFIDDRDRERLLDRLADRVEQYNIRLYLYVWMTTHFHLVFETPEGNCSRFMQSLLTAYTVYYNLRHGRHGHLLDGRYKAKLVSGDRYLLALTRYVHLNPVEVKSVKSKPVADRIRHLRRYRWSSYPGYIGRRKRDDFVDYTPLLAMMYGKRTQRPSRYRAFVEKGLAEDDGEFRAALDASPHSIGDDVFRARIDALYQELLGKHGVPEDVSFRRATEPLPVDSILAIVAEELQVGVDAFRQRRRNSPLRAIAARMLVRFGALTQRQVAALLEMGTGGAVSAQVRRLPQLLAADRHLRRVVKKVEKRLEAARTRQHRGGRGVSTPRT